MANIIKKITELAVKEWEFFKKQEFDINGNLVRRGMEETDEGFWQRVGVYWLQGTGSHLTGRNTDLPWSATFVSYIMRQAGADARFNYSPQHSVYIRAAIKARQSNRAIAGFWGYRLSEYAPKVGDLVCYSRQAGINYDTPSSNYKSHSDIVIAKEGNTLKVIGGNVVNSVSMKHLKLDANGILIDRQKAWFTVLENRLDV